MIDNTVVISTPPHVKSKRTTRGIMCDVAIALLPCAIAGIVYFGWQAFVLEITSVLGCIATEFVYYFIAKGGFAKKCKNAGKVCKKWFCQFDMTSVVTGLILALIIPSTTRWYEVLVGSIFSIAIVKMFFGGTGKNLVNPAAAGRVFMFLSFALTTYVAANIGPTMLESELFTGATNLSGLLPKVTEGAASAPYSAMTNLDLFLGTGVAGCIGETCKLAILIGYVYLCVRKVIKWWQPALFIAVFGFVSVLAMGGLFYDGSAVVYKFDIELFLPSVLSGGVLFAAVFMFTDYVTSPKGVWGQLVYYVIGAALLAVLRVLTHLEVASFIILIMNIFVPLIDRFIMRKPFGYIKQKKTKEGK